MHMGQFLVLLFMQCTSKWNEGYCRARANGIKDLSSLDAECRRALQEGYHDVRDRMVLRFHMSFDYWLALPWSILRLAAVLVDMPSHDLLLTTRAFAADLIVEYDRRAASSVEASRLGDVSHRFLAADSKLRVMICHFSAGEPMHTTLRLLCCMLCIAL